MNQSKIDKSSHYLFGFIFVTLTIFSFFLTKEVSALRNTAPQVGNNDQICVGGYLYTITATNWRYQKQLQKYATYIDSSDIARGCLQEYVLNEKTGRYTLQCRHYDGTNTDMTFRVDNTQNRLSCKSSIDIDSSKFTNYEFTPNLSYQHQSCPISTSNVEGIEPDDWGPLDISDKITQDFDASTQLWRVTVTGLKNVSVRLINGTRANANDNIRFVNYLGIANTSYVAVNGTAQNTSLTNAQISAGYVSNLYRSARVTDNGDGTQTLVFYMTPGSEYYIQFVLNNGNSDCNGLEVAHVTGGVSTMVPSSIFTNGTKCQTYTNWALTQNNSVISSLYKSLVPECYSSADIDYTRIDEYERKVDRATSVLQSVASSVQNATTGTTTIASQCDFDPEKNVQTYTYASKLSSAGYEGEFGTYWDALCTETVTVTFDTPKALSAAGAAFTYPSTITVSRQCTPYQVIAPQFKTQCKYTVECWGGPANHTGEAGAGPNDEFDSCIMQCDGGSYTQNCIDSCYSSVYENQATDSLITSFNFFAENYTSTEKTASISGCSSSNIGKVWPGKTRLPLSSCSYDTGNVHSGGGNCTDTTCTSTHGISYTYLDTCNATGNISGTACYEVFTSSPLPNCIEVFNRGGTWYVGNTNTTYTDAYAIQEYEKLIAQSNLEYSKLQAAMQQFKDNENSIDVAIKDSYTGETHGPESGYEAVIKYSYVDKATGEQSYLTAEEYKQKTGTDPTLGTAVTYGSPQTIQYANHGQGADYQSITIQGYEVNKSYEIILPEMYVSNVNIGDYKYGLTTNDEKSGYTNGGNKYYTHILSPGINDVLVWDNYTTVSDLQREHTITNNIKVTYSLGTWNQIQNSTIDCFYGIPDNSTFTPEPECTGENCYNQPCGPNDICDNNGLIYIWRTIDLYDMFPANETLSGGERQPRWNWSSAAIDVTNQRYPVNPTKVIEDVESKGDTIYGNEEELDYRIILTRQNLRNLRSYNATHGSYTDFEDMTCTYDEIKGVSVCTSSLLPTQGGSSEYMTMVDKGIAGCNNEQGEDCIDASYTITNGG